MAKKKIGTWNGYDIYWRGGERWTVETAAGEVKNEMNSAETFGHWVFHSGFMPDGAKAKRLVLGVRRG